MSKFTIFSLVLVSTIAYAPIAVAWEDSRKNGSGDDDVYKSLRDNTPKSYTLSGDSFGRRSRSSDDSDSRNLRNYDNSQGSSNGAYRNGNQINNNGLIINRE